MFSTYIVRCMCIEYLIEHKSLHVIKVFKVVEVNMVCFQLKHTALRVLDMYTFTQRTYMKNP